MVTVHQEPQKSPMTYFERMRAAETALTAASKHSRPGDPMGPSHKPVAGLQSSAWATPVAAQPFVPNPQASPWSTFTAQRARARDTVAARKASGDAMALDPPQQSQSTSTALVCTFKQCSDI